MNIFLILGFCCMVLALCSFFYPPGFFFFACCACFWGWCDHKWSNRKGKG